MKIAELIWNPFVLLFFTIVAGLMAGSIQVKKFRLGSSGALFVGLFTGYGAVKGATWLCSSGTGSGNIVEAAERIASSGSGQIVDKNLFTMALIFFVAAVGLHAASNVGTVVKKYGAKFVFLGLFITMIGAGSSYIAGGIIDGGNVYLMSGIYTGALTSSPGLAAAIEAAENRSEYKLEHLDQLSPKEQEEMLSLTGAEEGVTLSEEQKRTGAVNANGQVGMGYAIGYPFGVIAVILSMNLLPVVFKIDPKKELELYNREMCGSNSPSEESGGFHMLGLGIVLLVGYLVGNVKIPLGSLGDFSLEVTGGVLISALVLGYVAKVGPVSFRMNGKILDVIREIAVVFFLAIVGLNYGYGAITALGKNGAVTAAVALGVAVVSILAGFLVGRYLFKINWIMLSGALCGGMTSTPGLGAAIEAAGSEGPAGGYGATYPFALLGMILFTIFMHSLPVL